MAHYNPTVLRRSEIDEMLNILGIEETLRQIGDYLHEKAIDKESTQLQRQEANWNEVEIREAIDNLFNRFSDKYPR